MRVDASVQLYSDDNVGHALRSSSRLVADWGFDRTAAVVILHSNRAPECLDRAHDSDAAPKPYLVGAMPWKCLPRLKDDRHMALTSA